MVPLSIVAGQLRPIIGRGDTDRLFGVLARSVSYGTINNYLQRLQRFLLDRGWSGHFSE